MFADSKQWGSKGMTIFKTVVTLFYLVLSTVLYAANTGDVTDYKHEYYLHEFQLLQHYKQVYAEEQEIFYYCVEKYKEKPKSYQSAPFGGFAIGSKVGSCMRKQIKIKDKILDFAQGKLGERSLAQDIYDECTDYYPKSSAARIGDCVKTRVVLDGRLEDDTVEKKIYKKCDRKWRKHGPGAIDNCSRTEATYYRDKGRLRD